ncbi:septal ring-binding cell division protein DamX [Streptacidiphilus sp. MAP12-33]|uniref:Mucin-19 n=1 Tax=Streptacidiphilus sp. MAP12-33 TaxID=3156266 RepID=UPI00351245BA
MDAKAYNAGLAELRGMRDDIKELAKELVALESERDKLVVQLGGYAKANADRLAPAAGLAVADIVVLAPHLGPQEPTGAPETSKADVGTTLPENAAQTPSQAPEKPVGALAPDLRRAAVATEVTAPASTLAPAAAAASASASASNDGEQEQTPAADVAPAPGEPAAVEAAVGLTQPATEPTSAVASAGAGQDRTLPSIPEGAAGDRWTVPTPGLSSKRPNFTQQVRGMAFLDTLTGVLVFRDQQVRVDLGSGSVGEILTAVYAAVPASVERIYVTAGDPWHREAERYPYLRDAVAAWLAGPLPEGWTVESSRGKDRMAGHLVHERRPVGRWQRGDQHCEIRSVGEWFDPAGADPAVVRDAFVLLWQNLRHQWSDVVLMGSPSQTGRDLWSRTIPSKAGARWAEGYPVMSEEVRGLLHATAGQGRTELLTPPRVPAQLPGWVELDRTFAYAKHCWSSGVGEPKRVSAQAFAAMPEKEQTNALFAPSHWQIRVTVPEGWQHVGLLPAPITGDKAWAYPNEPGRTFTTWAGGAEVNLALRNALGPWRIEILDGLLWETGTPLKDWSTKLKDVWGSLRAMSEIHMDPRQRQAAALASRAVRSILLFGIGGFAQRPNTVTGQVPIGMEAGIPDGAQIIGMSDTHVTWQGESGFSRNPYAHPEWAAGVWSGARAALLSTRMREDNVSVGALHLPPGSIVAFRTDAIYATVEPSWPYHGQPGDYLLKGRIPEPVAAPGTDEEFFALQAAGRARYTADLEASQ